MEAALPRTKPSARRRRLFPPVLPVLLLSAPLTNCGASAADIAGGSGEGSGGNVRGSRRRISATHHDDDGHHSPPNNDDDRRLLLLLPPFPSHFRNFDGVGNNEDHPEWGAASTPYRRAVPAAYGNDDGGEGSSPSGADRPNARSVSRIVCLQEEEDVHNLGGATDMVWQMGQLLDHDIAETPTGEERFDIKIPECDEYFWPCETGGGGSQQGQGLGVLPDYGEGEEGDYGGICKDSPEIDFAQTRFPTCPSNEEDDDSAMEEDDAGSGGGEGEAPPEEEKAVVMPFRRSKYRSVNGAREQVNQITAFIDCSNVYGSVKERARALRKLDGTGKLKMSHDVAGEYGEMLPYNTMGLHNAGGDDNEELYVAGDIRVNEQTGLIAIHTLWAREHNHWCGVIAEDAHRRGVHFEDDAERDEHIYQRARAVVTAEMQAIIYREFLPTLLGDGALPDYEGYDRTVNPSIANVFAGAAYRLGHTMISSTLKMMDHGMEPAQGGHLELMKSFFRPAMIRERGIDEVLRGLADGRAQEVDTMVVDDLQNFLFGRPGQGGFDLCALNIQRGRDHGLPPYNDVRKVYGLRPVKDFADIPGISHETRDRLERAYGGSGNIRLLDAFVGMLAEGNESHEEGGGGSMVGETIKAVLVDQFARLRNGDRYWYQTYLHRDLVEMVESQTMSDIIRRNTGIGLEMQENVFLHPDSPHYREPHEGEAGPRKSCGDACGIDRECESGCCLTPEKLRFGRGGGVDARLRRELAPTTTMPASAVGQCIKAEWCECLDRISRELGGEEAAETGTGSMAAFVECVHPRPPFDCDEAKPIVLLRLRWKGDATIGNVTALNGRGCDEDKKDGELLFRIDEVRRGDDVVFDASNAEEGELSNDLTLCFETHDGERAMSSFHISCSDENLRDQGACEIDQGGGKTKKGKGRALVDKWKLLKLSGTGKGGGSGSGRDDDDDDSNGMRVTLNCGIHPMEHM